jgi:hypothetical protein
LVAIGDACRAAHGKKPSPWFGARGDGSHCGASSADEDGTDAPPNRLSGC